MTIAIIFLGLMLSSYVIAMENPMAFQNTIDKNQEQTIMSGLYALQANKKFELKSIYKQLLPLLSSEDIIKISWILESDVILASCHATKHILFLKLLIETFSKNSDKYRYEKVMNRIQIYEKCLNEPTIYPTSIAWLNQTKRLDELLRFNSNILKEKEFESLKYNVISLLSLLRNKNKFVHEQSYLGTIKNFELFVLLNQEKYNEIPDIYRTILIRYLEDIVSFYGGALKELEHHINQKIKKNEHLSLQFNASFSNAHEKKLRYYDSNLNLKNNEGINKYFSELLDLVSIPSLKAITSMLIEPHIQSVLFRFAFIIKLIALDSSSTSGKTYQSCYLKDIILCLLNKETPNNASLEELMQLEGFLNIFSKMLQGIRDGEFQSLAYTCSKWILSNDSVKKNKLIEAINCLSSLVRYEIQNLQSKKRTLTLDTNYSYKKSKNHMSVVNNQFNNSDDIMEIESNGLHHETEVYLKKELALTCSEVGYLKQELKATKVEKDDLQGKLTQANEHINTLIETHEQTIKKMQNDYDLLKLQYDQLQKEYDNYKKSIKSKLSELQSL